MEKLSQVSGSPLRILLVDDSFKTGSAMGKAVSLVVEAGESLRAAGVEVAVKTAVIVFRSDLRDERKGSPPDYYVYENTTYFPYGKV